MEPTHEQAQLSVAPVAASGAPRAAAAALPAAKTGGLGRWIAAVASLVAVVAVAVAVTSLEEPTWQRPLAEDLTLELSPLDVLRHQSGQSTRPRAQRLQLLTSYGHVLLREGRLAEAGAQFEAALPLADSSGEHAETRRLLGLTRLRQGRLRPALDILLEAMNAWSEDTEIGVLRALAEVRMELGHFKTSFKMFNQAFDLADRRRDADTAAAIATDIAELWLRRSKLRDSLEWLTTAERALGTSLISPAGVVDEASARLKSVLGFVRHRSGDIAAATGLYRVALRTQSRSLHPSHPDLVSTQLGLARARRDLGQAAEALRDLEAVERTLREHAREGPSLGRVLLMRADLLREANQTALATEVVQEAIKLQDVLFQGEDHPDAATAMSCYGSILHDAGMAEQAQEKYEQALAVSLRTVGPKHPGTAFAHNSLGTLYEDAGDDATAHEHFSKCLEIQLETLGKDSPDVATTYNNMATVLFRQGNEPEAAKLLNDALRVLERAGVPQDNPDRRLYAENLELLLARRGGVEASVPTGL